MAPTVQIDYRGQRESNKFLKVGLEGVMGKTRKVSKGHASGFVPDFRHAVETMAEKEGLGSSGRDYADLDASEDYTSLKRKYKNMNVDGFDRFGGPMRSFPLSKMSRIERKDLMQRLKNELDQIKMFQRNKVSFSRQHMVQPPATDTHSYQNGSRNSMMESFPVSRDDVASAAQGKKKGHVGKNDTRTKGGAVVARRIASMKQDPPQNTSFPLLMKQCENLLNKLMGHKVAYIFNEPVDIVTHNIPDYFNVIKHPMDLGTVKRKLLKGQYSSPMGFAADVRLTFQNALTYNPVGHDVHAMAQALSKFFENRWKPIEKKIPQTTETIYSPSNVCIEPEIAYIPPIKKQKTASVENKVKKEPIKRVMSSAEKQNLREELEASLVEIPESIINFLKEINESQPDDDEIEIDIDTLSDENLFMLRKLLDDHLLEKQKSQATAKPHENEMNNVSGFINLSLQLQKENEAPDEDVDIDGDDPPPFSSSTPVEVDTSAAQRNGNGSSSSSESGSTSSDTESESSSADELETAKSTVPGSNLNESVDSRAEHKVNDIGDANTGGQTVTDFSDDHADQNSLSNSTIIGTDSHQQGESAPPNSQVSPEKNYRAAILRSRFADIIIKAQENSIEKGERPDPEKMKHEREELERRRREEKARLQAEAKAAEVARKKAEEEAAADAKRKREVEREEARLALQKMEKTVDINENSQFMEDLEMLKSAAPDELLLQSFVEDASNNSPEFSQNGFGSFKFGASNNPLEQLGLYMKNDEEEEEVDEPQNMFEASNDPEEGEID